MSFIPIDVESTTLITPALLRRIESQIDAGLAFANTNIRQDDASPLKTEIRASNPANTVGVVYFNTTTGKMRGFDGIAWQEF